MGKEQYQKKLTHFEVMDYVVNGIIATNEVSQGIYNNQEILSKWLLGGALAILFAIFSNPNEIFNFYNIYLIKISIIFLVASIYNGILNILSHNFMNTLSKSTGLINILEKEIESKKEDNVVELLKDESGKSEESAIALYGIALERIFFQHLQKSNRLVLQTIFLSIPLLGILLSLIMQN